MKRVLAFFVFGLLFISAPALAAPMAGDIVKTSANSAVYFVDSGLQKHLFPDSITFRSWFPVNPTMKIVTASELSSLLQGKNVIVKPGYKYIRFTNSRDIYSYDSSLRLCKTTGTSYVTIGSTQKSNYVMATAPCTVAAKTVFANTTLLNVFNSSIYATYSLNVTSGNGTVTKSPALSVYPGGSKVSLLAKPNMGYVFSGWTGDIATTTNPVAVVMNGNKKVVADFTPVQVASYSVTVTSNNGTVVKNPSYSLYKDGTAVTLTATPNGGFVFSHWSGDVTSSSSQVTIFVNGNKNIIANFISITTNNTTTPATVEHIYISQSGTGNGDAANPRSVAWLSNAANWGTGAGKVSPGDIVHITGTITSAINIAGSGLAGNPVTVVFDAGSKMSAPYWNTYTPSFDNRGLPNSGAINIIGSHIILDGKDVTIEATENGTGSNHYSFAGVLGFNVEDVVVKNFKILNMYKRTEGSDDYWTISSGISMNGRNIKVLNCTVENSYYGIAVGAGSKFPVSGNNEIAYNSISGTAVGINAAMGTDGIKYENVAIHHNRVFNEKVWDGAITYNPFDTTRTFHRRDAIKIWGRPKDVNSWYKNLHIYNNVIGPDITNIRGASSGLIVVDTGTYVDPEINNNILIANSTEPNGAFLVFSGNQYAQTTPNAKIHNNTFFGNGLDVPVRLGGHTLGNQVWDNIFYKSSLGFYGGDQDTAIAYWDNNLWYPASGYGSFAYGLHHSSSWAQYPVYRWVKPNPYGGDSWVTDAKFDVRSTTIDPRFSNANNLAGPDGVWWTNDDGLRLQSDSPAFTSGRYGGRLGAY